MNRRSAGLTVPPDNSSPQDVGPDEEYVDQEGEAAGRGGDVEEEAPVPDLERLVTEAMALARDRGGPDVAALVDRFWRLVPDEDLVGRTPSQTCSPR